MLFWLQTFNGKSVIVFVIVFVTRQGIHFRQMQR